RSSCRREQCFFGSHCLWSSRRRFRGPGRGSRFGPANRCRVGDGRLLRTGLLRLATGEKCQPCPRETFEVLAEAAVFVGHLVLRQSSDFRLRPSCTRDRDWERGRLVSRATRMAAGDEKLRLRFQFPRRRFREVLEIVLHVIPLPPGGLVVAE